jgi:hypothetical protein
VESFIQDLEFHCGGREFRIEATPVIVSPDTSRFVTRVFEGEDLVNRDEVRDVASRKHFTNADDAIHEGILFVKGLVKK